jgi:hypothetical protein
VEPVSLVVAALGAGAAAGLQESTSAAVKDGYQALKNAIVTRFAGHHPAEVVLAQYDADPGTWAGPLRKAVADTGAASDTAIMAAALRMMVLLEADGMESGRRAIDARSAQGVQVGHHNQQVNTFRGSPLQPHRGETNP